MTRRERLYSVLEDYDSRDLVSVVGTIAAYDDSFYDVMWREMDVRELWDQCYDSAAFEHILDATASGEFNPNDDYYRWGDYGLESSDCPDFDLDDIATWLDENFDRIDRIFSDYYAEDFLAADDAPEEDDTDWPEDATDYDGVDDPDEDEPSPAKPAILTEAQLHEQLRAFYPSFMTGKDDTQIAQLINALQIWCQMLHGHYITGTGELAEAINRYLSYRNNPMA